MLKVKCPAKINLTLEVLNKRNDGFHNIQSVMQTISLFDILTINLNLSEKIKINLSGTSDEIPYDERNLVYKACLMFLEELGKPFEVNVFIEKNIPVAAGLAGGSTDAAGVIFGLNEILNKPFDSTMLHNFCAKLGSDLNFCLEGGCKLATGRGEILNNLPFKDFDLCLIKPKNLYISAKEAYLKFAELESKPNLNMTQKYIDGDSFALHNDLEYALINDYPQLRFIKSKIKNSIMSGSGSTFFVLQNNSPFPFDQNFEVLSNLKAVNHGVVIL